MADLEKGEEAKTLEHEVTEVEGSSTLASEQKEFLKDVPLRDQTMVSVGGILYVAASPDVYDGLSEKEFEILSKEGGDVFALYELLGRVGLPDNFKLPEGFGKHFANDVIPDLRVIRSDPAKRDEFRREISSLLHNRSEVGRLYTDGGKTYSEILSRVAGSNREGAFYGKSGGSGRPGQRPTVLVSGSAAVDKFPRTESTEVPSLPVPIKRHVPVANRKSRRR